MVIFRTEDVLPDQAFAHGLSIKVDRSLYPLLLRKQPAISKEIKRNLMIFFLLQNK